MKEEIKIPFSMRVLSIARSQLGFAEDPKGSNRGKHVEKYLASVGLPGGNSWCMAFVHWCYQEGAKESDIKNPLFKTGGVLAQWNHTPINNKTVHPQPGDIFIQDHGGGLGHTGIVESVVNDYVNTIEGNTNDDGAREGYEVARRCRTIKSIKGFIHYP